MLSAWLIRDFVRATSKRRQPVLLDPSDLRVGQKDSPPETCGSHRALCDVLTQSPWADVPELLAGREQVVKP